MSQINLEKVHLFFPTTHQRFIMDILSNTESHFSREEKEGVHALNNVSLHLANGDHLAVIGHNGAGKSTLLRTINGIYEPSRGMINVEGRVSGMFEFSTGFQMEASGWDNIYLRGLMLGESPAGIISKMPEIAEFSELGEFLNMPVKYYSSGMFMRLAFSVSTAISPDILLLDEMLAAGDAAFVEKAGKRMNELIESSKILVLVTHNMESAIRLCNRCVWMDRGRILDEGTPEEVTERYVKRMTG